MYSTLSTAQLVFDSQTLREWLALLQTCRGCSLQCAFLSVTCWTASTMNTCLCTTCVRSPSTKYCSRVELRVCAACRCTPHSSSHTSPALFERCTVWHLTRTPTRCCSSWHDWHRLVTTMSTILVTITTVMMTTMSTILVTITTIMMTTIKSILMTTISWCRSVATRANGSKCSGSTPEFFIMSFLILRCATRVYCSFNEEGTRCTCLTWVQNTLCATRAVWLCRVVSTGSRAPAAMASRSSHSHMTHRWLCCGSRHSHCVSCRSRASALPLPAGSVSAETCCSSLTGTTPPARTPSCRFARLTTRSLSDECSSTLRPVFAWAPGLSRATDLFSGIGKRRSCLSTTTHAQFARERHAGIEGHYWIHFSAASPPLRHSLINQLSKSAMINSFQWIFKFCSCPHIRTIRCNSLLSALNTMQFLIAAAHNKQEMTMSVCLFSVLLLA